MVVAIRLADSYFRVLLRSKRLFTLLRALVSLGWHYWCGSASSIPCPCLLGVLIVRRWILKANF